MPILALVIYWVLVVAGKLRRVLDETGIRNLVRIIGLLPVATAMQYFVNGIKDLVKILQP
jgi:multiple antibiotic resistance protein